MIFEKSITTAKILGTYISVHSDKAYKGDDYFVTKPVEKLEFTTEGIFGDRHFGYEVSSGGRFQTLYQRGSIVRNNRQWSAISTNELEEIGKNLGIEEKLTAELLGINLLIEGIDKLSLLKPMTYIALSQCANFKPKRNEDAVLVVYAEAIPCKIAGKALVEPFGDTSLEGRFMRAANFKRGTTGWVEKGGIVMPGYYAHILTPTGRD